MSEGAFNTSSFTDEKEETEKEQLLSDKTQLTTKYADILQKIYDGRTAGDYTFFGVLAEFVHEWEKVAEKPAINTDATVYYKTNHGHQLRVFDGQN